MPLQNNPLFTESYPTSQSACLERCHDTHSDGVYTGGLEASSAPVLGESKTCLQNPLWGRTVKKTRHFLAMPFSEIFWDLWGFGFGKKAHPANTSYKRRSRKSSLRQRCSLSMWMANFDEICLSKSRTTSLMSQNHPLSVLVPSYVQVGNIM